MPDLALDVDGWLQLALRKQLSSCAAISYRLGLPLEEVEAILTGQVPPSAEFIARCLVVFPVSFEELFSVQISEAAAVTHQ